MHGSEHDRNTSGGRRRLVIPLLVGVLVLVAGCGQSASNTSGSSSTSAAVTTLRVGFIPVVESAPLYLADQLGYFRDEHLKVQLESQQTAASIVPSVLNGQLQIGVAATVPFTLAVCKGLPIRAIASTGNGGPKESSIVVKAGSGITSPVDLADKTVAVNQLNAVLQLVTLADIAKDRGNASSAKFIALPFPDAISAVKSGRVDAATVVEPFTTIAAQSGLDVIAHPYADVLPPGANIAVAFVSTAYLAAHRAALSGFVTALNRATTYAATHPQAVRQAVTKYSTISPRLSESINLPAFVPSLTSTSVEPTLQLMVQFQFLSKAPSLSTLIATP